MRHTKVTLSLIISLFMVFAYSSYCMADDTKELEWVDNKATAFELAKEQGKFVFLLVGLEFCPKCLNAIDLLNKEPFRSIVDDNYIMWRNHWSNTDTRTEVNIYTDEFFELAQTQTLSFPFLYIINPDEPGKTVASKWMPTMEEAPDALAALLNTHTTSNDQPTILEQKAFISGNTLNIFSDMSDEKIYVYSIDGKYVTSFYKKDNQLSVDASNFPKGVLVIYSSKKWSLKIINN